MLKFSKDNDSVFIWLYCCLMCDDTRICDAFAHHPLHCGWNDIIPFLHLPRVYAIECFLGFGFWRWRGLLRASAHPISHLSHVSRVSRPSITSHAGRLTCSDRRRMMMGGDGWLVCHWMRIWSRSVTPNGSDHGGEAAAHTYTVAFQHFTHRLLCAKNVS